MKENIKKLKELAKETLINFDQKDNDEEFITTSLAFSGYIKDYNFLKNCRFFCNSNVVFRMFLSKLIEVRKAVLSLILDYNMNLDIQKSETYDLDDIISTLILNYKSKSFEEIKYIFGLRYCGHVYSLLLVIDV